MTLTWFCLLTDYDSIAEKAGKIENEIKRLHNLIIEINNHKLKAQQDKLDKLNKEIDECTSTVTKAQVAVKTADRYSRHQHAQCKAVGCNCVLLPFVVDYS